ncbi:MAG: radical SAM protein [Gammaproteobacteria bacterium]|nr:radical SAM protein [Gammaproteobacteria bacterium]
MKAGREGVLQPATSSVAAAAEPPYLVALNLTRRCNLSCAHCYLDAGALCHGDPGELDTEEVKRLIGQIAALSDQTMVVLTGGEPLLRADILALAEHAASLGLMVVLGTNGTLLTPARAEALAHAGVRAVGISVDSAGPVYHDRFRGVVGAWRKTMAGIDACRHAGLMFQIHFTVTDDNASQLEEMIELARETQAAVLNVFFLVCTGRGERLTNISAPVYARVLQRLAAAARDENELLIRARCAPHFKRMALELRPSLPVTRLDGYDAGGCLAGTRYCRVTPEGELTPCPYMELSAGTVRNGDFARLWHTSPLFAQLRSPKLSGRCGVCEYRLVCGGCRARPLARSGNLMGEDFLCDYEPGGGAVLEEGVAAAAGMPWTAAAEARLHHVPVFVRRFVKRRAENYAREHGADSVREDHLIALARRRFGAWQPGTPAPSPGIDK